MEDGTGTAFGAQVLRYSWLGSLALALSQAAGLVNALVIVHFVGAAEFGRLALLLLFAALVAVLVGLGARPGTIQRVFGLSDDDDEEDEEAAGVGHTKRALGTGFVLTLMIGGLAIAASLALAEPIAQALFGAPTDPELVALAAAAGSLAAVYQLASAVVWMQRRPTAFVRLAAAQPLLILVAVVPLLALGGGLEAAIAAIALGIGTSAVLALIALHGDYELALDRREAAAILRRGPARVPARGSLWVIEYGGLFLLSRFVAPAEVGVFHLASRFAIGIAVIAGGVQLALRPLMRTNLSVATEEQYGASTARGFLLGYFLLALIGLLLGTVLVADALEPLLPSFYASAASLVLLLAAAQIAPTALKVLYKSVKFPDKRRVYVGSLMTAAALFVVLALVLIPWLGLEGVPVATLAAFAGPTVFVLWRSQRGASALVIPYRLLLLGGVAAIGCAIAYKLMPDLGPFVEVALVAPFFLAWLGTMVAIGAVPREHRGGLVTAARSAIGHRRKMPDVLGTLPRLTRDERVALRMAIIDGRTLEEIAPLLDEDPAVLGERLVRALRRIPRDDWVLDDTATEHDRHVARYVLSSGSVAARDSVARRLLRSGRASARDLHELEMLVASLKRAPPEDWASDDDPQNLRPFPVSVGDAPPPRALL